MAVTALRRELDDSIRQLYETHEKQNCENEPQNVMTSSNNTNTKVNSNNTTLKMDIISGEHVGTTYLVTPTPDQPCLLGRSKGKKFKQNGVSLFRDLEVSTTHGKFTVDAEGRFYFTDTGSSNGTYICDAEIGKDVPYLLNDGIEIKMGQSILKVTFVCQSK